MITHDQLINLGFAQCKTTHNRYEKQEFSTKYVAILKKGYVVNLHSLKTNYISKETSVINYPISCSDINSFVIEYESISGFFLPKIKSIEERYSLIKIFLTLLLLICFMIALLVFFLGNF